MQSAPDHAPILQAAFGFWTSQVLLTAVDFGLFTTLIDGSQTGDELGQKLGLHPRGIWDFLDALVALRFLERDGDGREARYRNSAAARVYLDKASDRYIGGIIEMLSARTYRFWGDLPEALKTGQPQNEIKHRQQPLFAELYADPARLEQFLQAMKGISRINFETFAEKFDFSKYNSLCDVGGATGEEWLLGDARSSRRWWSHFDLPQFEPIAKRTIAAKGLGDRVQVVSGDFFRDPLPKADVITMGQILHDWNLEQKLQLIRAAYDALPEGGAFVAIENLIDDARRENLFGLLMSLNMLIEIGDAFDYTGADFRGWCQQVGFRRFEIIPLSGPASAAVAYK